MRTLTARIIVGDAIQGLRGLNDRDAQCCVTSPPYWGLRDYQTPGQIGLESSIDEYVDRLVEVFREVRRVLARDGTLWLNLGDSYAGSWGAQSRPNGNDLQSNLQGRSQVSARHIAAQPKRTGTGSMKNTPGLKPKDLCGIPWRVAFALQADGWWLRSDIIWHKPNTMPESVIDRPTKAHEYLFLLSKSKRYYYDAKAIAVPVAGDTKARLDRAHGGYHPPGQSEHTGHSVGLRGNRRQRGLKHGLLAAPQIEEDPAAYSDTRNARTVWSVATRPFRGAHFATFPPQLIEPCVLAGSRRGGLVLDPFCGAGTTGLVANRLGRAFVGVEINRDYAEMARTRLVSDSPGGHNLTIEDLSTAESA